MQRCLSNSLSLACGNRKYWQQEPRIATRAYLDKAEHTFIESDEVYLAKGTTIISMKDVDAALLKIVSG